MDSSLTLLNFFNRNYHPHWQIRRRWENCIELLSSMEVRSSHIYREGNVPADNFSNVALSCNYLVWWDMDFYDIMMVVNKDIVGMSKYRFF